MWLQQLRHRRPHRRIPDLGGDARYTFTADGGTPLEKPSDHKTILDIDFSPSSNKLKQTVSGIHTHVLSNVPEESDVFHGLTRKRSIPEHIGTLHRTVHRNRDKKIWVLPMDGRILLRK
jgi:hypothetical protein